MPYRGRLIWRTVVEVRPIETLTTEATGGYDHRFREPKTDAAGEEQTKFGQTYKLPCQFQTERTPNTLMDQEPAGNDPDTTVYTLFHYQDIEDAGMLDDKGRPTIRLNDRLVALWTADGELIRNYEEDALYATEVKDRSHGLSGLRRNLLRVRWEAKRFSPSVTV